MNIKLMDTKLAVQQLASMAQEARLEIYRLLVQAGTEGLAAGSIGVSLQIPASTLSFHLKELSRAGLIHARQQSRFIYYSANYDAMEGLLAYLTENCCDGTRVCGPASINSAALNNCALAGTKSSNEAFEDPQ